jgi:hypothetical protein
VSRDPYPGHDQEDPENKQDEPGGRMRLTPPGVVAAWTVVGLVGGWLVRPVTLGLDLTAPRITWVQAFALYLVAAILGVLARSTYRTVRLRRGSLRAHEALNRLVLAKACAVVGALATGGYLGYALAWVGVEAELADQRIVRSLVAALGGALTVVTALLLERACRVGDGPSGTR